MKIFIRSIKMVSLLWSTIWNRSCNHFFFKCIRLCWHNPTQNDNFRTWKPQRDNSHYSCLNIIFFSHLCFNAKLYKSHHVVRNQIFTKLSIRVLKPSNPSCLEISMYKSTTIKRPLRTSLNITLIFQTM